jgi:hypothetical protein
VIGRVETLGLLGRLLVAAVTVRRVVGLAARGEAGKWMPDSHALLIAPLLLADIMVSLLELSRCLS